MIHFRDIRPAEMTEEDKELLVKMSDADYDGRRAVDLLAHVFTDRCGLIRIEGDIQALMLVRKTRDKLGWTLWIDSIAGEGFLSHLDEFETEMVKLAHSRGCASISGIAERLGLAVSYEKMNWPVAARIFRKVLDHAEQKVPS